MRRRIILTLALVIIGFLAVVIAEYIALWRAQSIIENAATLATQYAVTGQYDTDVFYIDSLWLPADGPGNSYLGSGVPCPADPPDKIAPRSLTIFRDHWGKDCSPTSDEDYYLRNDILQLPSIVLQAQLAARDLPLAKQENGVDPSLDIPGIGLGAQTYEALLKKAETVPDWFHVYICSTRHNLVSPGLRYAHQEDYEIATTHPKLARCTMQEATTYGPSFGTDQYDAGGIMRETITVIVYYNYRPLTPLGRLLLTGDQPFVRLQARREAITEGFGPAKVINVSDVMSTPPNTPTATATPR